MNQSELQDLEPHQGEITGKDQVTYEAITTHRVTRTRAGPNYSFVDQAAISNAIRSFVYVPVMLTSTVFAAILAVFALILGIGILAIPFVMVAVFSGYVAQRLRKSREEFEVVDYEYSEAEKQEAQPQRS